MKKTICVTGLGFIGLPTACILATSGYYVRGVDIDIKVVFRVQSGCLVDPEPDLQNLLRKAIQNGTFEVSTEVAPASIHIIAVPIPLSDDNQPDVSYLYAAAEAIRPHLRATDLVLIESTCPIGTTELIAKKLQETCQGVMIAYCPERALPGNILYELINNDRVVGGIDAASTTQAVHFYQSFTSGEILATNVRTAEAVKLAENAYRDINIAYANELSMVADRLNLDTAEVIQLANKHPRVQILNPGPGVGGQCIAVNPWFLVSSAPDLAVLTSKARNVNINKTNWVITKIRDAMKNKNTSVIACLGLSYKPNVPDLRGSPAYSIVQVLEKEFNVLRVDPYFPNTEALYDALDRAEVIVGLVAHNAFLNIPPNYLLGKVVLDFAGVFR